MSWESPESAQTGFVVFPRTLSLLLPVQLSCLTPSGKPYRSQHFSHLAALSRHPFSL